MRMMCRDAMSISACSLHTWIALLLAEDGNLKHRRCCKGGLLDCSRHTGALSAPDRSVCAAPCPIAYLRPPRAKHRARPPGGVSKQQAQQDLAPGGGTPCDVAPLQQYATRSPCGSADHEAAHLCQGPEGTGWKRVLSLCDGETTTCQHSPGGFECAAGLDHDCTRGLCGGAAYSRVRLHARQGRDRLPLWAGVRVQSGQRPT